MKAGICCVAALMGAMGMGIAGEVAAENNSSPAPLLGQQVTITDRQKARPDPVAPLLVAPYKLGVCRAINHPDDIAPTGDAKTYLYEYLHKDFDFSFAPDGSDRTDTSVRIIEQPKHGRLVQQYPDATDYQKSWYQYIPDDNFEGYDKFVMEVSASGNTVQIYYTMGVASGPIGGMNEQGERTDSSLCDQPHWKISAILNKSMANQWGQTRLTRNSEVAMAFGNSSQEDNT